MRASELKDINDRYLKAVVYSIEAPSGACLLGYSTAADEDWTTLRAAFKNHTLKNQVMNNFSYLYEFNDFRIKVLATISRNDINYKKKIFSLYKRELKKHQGCLN